MTTLFSIIARLFAGDRALPRDIIHKKTGSARRYFLGTLGSVAFGLSLAMAVQVGLWPVGQYVTEFVHSVVPSDFSLGITKGKLQINKPLPYTIGWPSIMQEGLTDTQAPSQFIVFVSDAAVPNPGVLSTYDAMMVVTETTLYMKDKEHSYRAMPIDPTTTLETVTRADVDRGMTTILAHPFFRYRLYMIATFVVLFIGIFFGIGGWYVLTIAWYATVLDLINRAFRINPDISWMEEYRLLVFFHMPLVGIVTLFHTVFFHAVTGIIFTFFMVGWGIWALRSIEKEKPLASTKSSTTSSHHKQRAAKSVSKKRLSAKS